MAQNPPGAPSSDGVLPPSGPAQQPPADRASAKPEVELPPLGLTPQPPADPVAGKFKSAQTAYLKARQEALSKLHRLVRAAELKQVEEIQKSKAPPAAKTKALSDHWLNGLNDPALRGFVADYRRELKLIFDS